VPSRLAGVDPARGPTCSKHNDQRRGNFAKPSERSVLFNSHDSSRNGLNMNEKVRRGGTMRQLAVLATHGLTGSHGSGWDRKRAPLARTPFAAQENATVVRLSRRNMWARVVQFAFLHDLLCSFWNSWIRAPRPTF